MDNIQNVVLHHSAMDYWDVMSTKISSPIHIMYMHNVLLFIRQRRHPRQLLPFQKHQAGLAAVRGKKCVML